MTLTKFQTTLNTTKHYSPTEQHWKPQHIVPLTDLLAMGVSILLGISLSNGYPHYLSPNLSNPRHVFGLIGIICLWLAAIWLKKGYTSETTLSSLAGTKIVTRATFYIAGGLALADAIVGLPLIHPYLLISFPAGIVTMGVGRFLASLLIQRIKRASPSRLLFVGRSDDILDVLGNNFASRFPFHEVAGFALTDPEHQHRLPDFPNCHTVAYSPELDIATTAKQFHCEAVWVASVTNFGHKNVRRLAWNLRNAEASLYLEPMIEDVSETRLQPTPIGPRTVLSVASPRIRAANGWIKRCFDIVFSVLILILVAPIMIATAIAIKLEDGGPVFYLSERIGKKGAPYSVWKFRSMCIDAEEKVNALIKETGGQSLLFKMKDDPRITRVGKFIRKYSIDELPQFFNTLNGTMSVVGPRPQVQREVDEYDRDMFMRLEVPPGITGLWQVSGRSNLSAELAQALDLYYVDNWSFGLDLRIICATIKAVVKSDGAY